ncbi:hypothetical protein BH20ACT18_BH20ACT18_09360 [soil metagenome]
MGDVDDADVAVVACEPHRNRRTGPRDRPGGRIFEPTSEGREEDWGEVLTWEPPRRLTYLWHLRADRGDATEVEIAFTD